MLQLEPISVLHDRTGFDCGNDELNNYLRTTARQHAGKHISNVRVLVDDAKPAEIIGFYSLSVCEVRVEALPADIAKKYPPVVPAQKLGRLAVDCRFQRNGHGQLLVVEAIRQTVLAAGLVGGIGLFVDAKDAEAAGYYRDKLGFVALPDDDLRLFLPIETLRQLDP